MAAATGKQDPQDRFAGAMESLMVLSESMQQASSLLADEDPAEEAPNQAAYSFLNVVALGNVGAGKSAVLNSLIGHPVLPTGENGATRAPILIQMQQRSSSSNSSSSSGNRGGLYIVLDGQATNVSASEIRHSLQGRLRSWTPSSSGGGGGGNDGIQLVLQSGAAPPLKLIDLPGLDSPASDESLVHNFAENTDAVLLVVVAAASSREVATSRALKLARAFDSDGTRTVGVISKVDQAASDRRSLDAVEALLSGQGPSVTLDIPWVALIGQSVSIAAAHAGSVSADDSLETAWRAEAETLKSILSRASPLKLGRVALVETLAAQMRKRLIQRLPNLLSGLEGKSQRVEEELVRLGEQRVQTSEGARAIALELCREFEDKFLQHIETGEGDGWKVVASFEGVLPNRIKQLPLDQMFELSSIKKLVLEADGYQPYLLSPEKGLRFLIRKALDLAKDPGKSCVDEVHRVLVEIVSATANATAGLGRYPPLRREVVAIASAALDEYRLDSKKMVIALVDMERSFIPPQHFIRLVQRRMERLRREEELKGRTAKKAQEMEQSLLNRATAPASQQGGSLKSLKQADKDTKDTPSTLQIVGDNVAGYLLKKTKKSDWAKRWFVLNEKTNKFAYTKTPEERNFRGVINLEECTIEDGDDDDAPATTKASSKDKASSNGPNTTDAAGLVFKISHKVAYKTLLKANHTVVLKAENMAEKLEWMSKLRSCIESTTKGASIKSGSTPEGDNFLQEGSTVLLTRPADPEEDLKLMAQEVRDYVEAVLNSLAANIPKAVVLCQVERAREAMLNQLYSSVSSYSTERIQELLQEGGEVKRRRERFQRQASMLSRLTRQLNFQEARASGFGDSGGYSGSSSNMAQSEDWRVAFEEAGSPSSSRSSNSPAQSFRGARGGVRGASPMRRESPIRGASVMNGQAYSTTNYYNNDSEENGDIGSRRTPSRGPPPPPPPSGARV
ncbi:unnamed protein product [Sphagnum balticum]